MKIMNRTIGRKNRRECMMRIALWFIVKELMVFVGGFLQELEVERT